MSSAPVPCPACGRPVASGLADCPSCGASLGALPTPAGGEPALASALAEPPRSPAATTAAADEDAPAQRAVVQAGALPGAYLPPSSVHRPAPSPTASYAPVQPPSAARPTQPVTGAPASNAAGWMPPAPAPSAAAPVPPPAAAMVPGRAALFADLPFDTPDSLAEWLVAAGSIVSAVSFLLPWAPNIVSYTSSWGLSSASRLPVLVLLGVAAILAILPNRVATWVRLGVLGLIGGSLYLGILWPYVFGDFGAEFGSVIGAAGAIVLLVGGIVGVAPHGDSEAA